MERRLLPLYITYALVALLILAGCNGPRYKRQETTAAPAGTASTAATQQLTAVRVVSPQPAADVAAATPLSATLRSAQQVMLAFQVSGQVAQVLKNAGDKVQTGDVLAELDKQLFQAQRDQAAGALAQAQAQLDLTLAGARPEEIAMAQSQVDSAQAVVEKAQADCDRAKKLYEQGVVPKQQLETAETGLKQAQEALKAAQRQLEIAKQGAREEEKQLARAAVQTAQAALRQAEAQLAYATLHAPFTGAVSMRQLEPGQVVAAGMPVFEVANLAQLEAEAAIPEGQFAEITVGQQVKVTFPALPGISAGGTVASIAPRADPATRGFSVKVKLLKAPAEVLPGMVALLSFPVAKAESGLSIPRRCVVDGKVFVVQQGVARQQLVKVIGDKGDNVLVTGLSPDADVVVNGQEYLKDGEQVRIVDAMAMDDLTNLSPHE